MEIVKDARAASKFQDANRALELIGKHLDMWTEKPLLELNIRNLSNEELTTEINRLLPLTGITEATKTKGSA